MKRIVAVVVLSLTAVLDPRPVAASDRLVTFSYGVSDECGMPFPIGTAGVMVCPAEAALLACDPMIFGAADRAGMANVVVDPAVTYRFTALVRGTGWPCGAWVSPGGTAFFFSDGVVTRPGRAKRSGTFAIVEPSCRVSP